MPREAVSQRMDPAELEPSFRERIEVTPFGPATIASCACGDPIDNEDLIRQFEHNSANNATDIEKADN